MPYLVTAVIPAHTYDPKKSHHTFHAESGNPTSRSKMIGIESSVSTTSNSATVAKTLASVYGSLFGDDNVTITEVDTIDNTDPAR